MNKTEETKPFNKGAFGLALLFVGCVVAFASMSPIPNILNSIYGELGNFPFAEVLAIVGACMFFVGGVMVLYGGFGP